MAKWHGNIGYAPSFVETAPGVSEEEIVVKEYYGDFYRNTRRLESSGQVNDNVNINNRISIVADPYARENFHAMRWIEYMGSKWKISDVEVEYPRLILSLGGLYNDNTVVETEDGSTNPA